MCAYMYMRMCVCVCVCMCVYATRLSSNIHILLLHTEYLLLLTTAAIPPRRVVTKSLSKIRRWSLEEESVPFEGQRAGTRPRSRVEK